jgi:AcrR family transcriptional regulator
MDSMSDVIASTAEEGLDTDDAGSVRSRDAANTRRLLLSSARRRFAEDGYSATRVRDIAADAGVNVALINRYFGSKEGLFESCLVTAREELGRARPANASFEDLLAAMTLQVAGAPDGDRTLLLLILLRSSGDEGADRIRVNTLRSFGHQMLLAAGWSEEASRDDDLMLRAQLALSTMLGVALLRASSTGLEPLTSAGVGELAGPLGDVISVLLRPDDAGRAHS